MVLLLHHCGEEERQQDYGLLAQLIACVKGSSIQRKLLQDAIQDGLDPVKEFLGLLEAAIRVIRVFLVLLDLYE